MVRRYSGVQRKGNYDSDSPYIQNYDPVQHKKWYQDPKTIVISGLVLLFLVLFFTNNLPWQEDTATTPDTNSTTTTYDELSHEQKLVNYILTQQKANLKKEDIVERLKLSGNTQSDIDRAFLLSDPTIQYIITEQKRGVSKEKIIEELLNQKHTPAQITAYLELLEEDQGGFSEALSKYWWMILLGLIAYMLYNNQTAESELRKSPKVYSLDQCREVAEEILEQKNLEFVPTTLYKVRGDLKQHRFIYAEPLYAEINDHVNCGIALSKRAYYLVAMGFDAELVDFQIMYDDNKIEHWLYNAAKGHETSGSSEYARMRMESERPLEPVKPEPSEDYNSSKPVNPYRRPTQRRPNYNRNRLDRRFSIDSDEEHRGDY
jgi:hypothetical protein